MPPRFLCPDGDASQGWVNLKEQLRSLLSKPSTHSFVREAQHTPGYSLFDLVHGYVYGRWPYLYIGIGTGEHPLARVFGPLARWLSARLPTGKASRPQQVTFADTYHGKVVPLDAATQLVTVGEEVELRDLEQVVPYARARDIVLKNPDHIVVLECPCRAGRSAPCLPLDVCLIVGEPFASFIVEHHPHRARRITSEQAVEILHAEHQRGHVHHAFFKDAMLNRFYAICNCCDCCCGAMQAWQAGTPMLASSGYVCRVDAAQCVGCGDCVSICPFAALSLDDQATAVIDSAGCMGCGVCISVCEQAALSLARDTGKSAPLELRELVASAG